MTSTDYLTLAEAAEIARVPIKSLRWWITCGKLRSYKPGRRRLVKRSELLAFIESTGSSVA
jgi:excisionase family DNA binding protein